MNALILAAGYGARMRPLTDHTPKPLLAVGGKRLIEWHLQKLAAMDVSEVVINTSHLADQFADALGDGGRWGLKIHYAYEGPAPLETGGGMLHALPRLGDAPFLVVNGDVWTNFDFDRLPKTLAGDAHLLLVDNPPHHPHGDFRLCADGTLSADTHGNALTFAGIGMFHPRLLAHWQRIVPDAGTRMPPAFPLLPLLLDGMRRGVVHGQHHQGTWTDVGTPRRLRDLDLALRQAGGPVADAP